MLVWLNKGDDYKGMLQKVTQGRIMYELYNRMTPDKQVEQWQVSWGMVLLLILLLSLFASGHIYRY
jgi:hypothetical protein